ncbi:sodium:alanine symporter family protein [Shewanella benthica KT99]|uniref:Sodium:alanine symporter family protein n=1 Tax=Shewanella benthica KT99 TaxID=314608 RepID=A9CUV1_9GAMM|nr:sodium:alanine symporter family protein [Shewanella benthica KT99]
MLIALGAFIKLDLILLLADTVNGLMAIPNLIALLGLRQVIYAEIMGYFKRLSAPVVSQ